MQLIIKADLYRYNRETKIIKGFKYEGFRYLFFLRKAAKSKKYTLKGIIYRYLTRKYSYKYGFQIPYKTSIGQGLYLGHFGPIVINPDAKIGDNCNLSHNVTIGQTNRGQFRGSPTLGNRVWVGPGSVIVGNISIGNDVLIAPNAFVNINVPNNSIVIGNPAKIISKTNATEGYIENILT